MYYIILYYTYVFIYIYININARRPNTSAHAGVASQLCHGDDRRNLATTAC